MKIDRPSTRAGFTLIEILIVILLMAIMMSILVGLYEGVIGTSRQAATKSTLIKVSRMLEDRTRAFHRYMDRIDKRAGKERAPEYVKEVSIFWNLFRNGRRDLARILARKHEFRKHFPQMFSEDNDYNFNLDEVIPNWPENDPNNFDSNMHLPETESAECLYYFLTQGETFGAEPVAADAFTSREVMDTDRDGLPEFVDSWGHPLRFYRWPTRLIRPNPSINNVGDPQLVLNTNNQELDRDFKFKIDERAASVILGPLPIPPQFSRLNMGDPIPSSRFPFPDDGNTYSNPTIATELEDPLSRDGDDPLGLTFRLLNSPDLRSRFENSWLSPEFFEKRYHTSSTYSIPLIISAGPDGEPGLYEPNDGLFYEPNDGLFNVQTGFYNDTNFGRLAQPILASENPLVVDERLHDDISNIFLRSGVTR